MSSDERPKNWNSVNVRNSRIIDCLVIGDESTQNNGGSVGNANGGCEFLCQDTRDIIASDIVGGAYFVVALCDHQIDLAVGVDEGNDFELQYNGLVLNGRLNGGPCYARRRAGQCGCGNRNIFS